MERLTERKRNNDGSGVSTKSLVVENGMKKGFPSGHCGRIVTKLADYEDLEEQGLLLRMPCKVGDTVYRICPKCNNDHDGSCKNCAWQGAAGMNGCNVYGLRIDGRYHPDECTIVPYKVTWNYIQNLLENMGKTAFLTREEAEAALQKMRESEE